MKFRNKDKRTRIEKQIDKLIEELEKTDIYEDQENYEIKLKTIERLYKLKEEKGIKISPDTIAIIIGNLVGIILILNYEKINVVTSKALGFVIRGRV